MERWPLLGRRGVMTPPFFFSFFLGGGGWGGECDMFIVPSHTYCNL